MGDIARRCSIEQPCATAQEMQSAQLHDQRELEQLESERDSLASQLAGAVENNERLLHGICDALDPGHPTEPILRALLRGTEHEHHRDEERA